MGVSLGLTVAAADFSFLSIRPRLPPAGTQNLSASRQDPPAQNRPAAAAEEDPAAAYLDAAEKRIAEKRIDSALEMLAKARNVGSRSWDLNIRLARIGENLTAGLLEQASASARGRSWRNAIAAAKSVLDRDPQNRQAIEILALARAAARPRVGDSSTGREGRISISVTPPAMVYVDDELIGQSPIVNRSIPSGRHVIQARALGYRPSDREVHVSPRQKASLAINLGAE
jgi:hypothetical protein